MSNAMNKTVLISGASGLLGNELVNQLLNNTNHHVIALTSQVEYLKKQLNQRNIMILDIKNWDQHVGNTEIDTFINCAFPRSSDPAQLAIGLTFTEENVKKAI